MNKVACLIAKNDICYNPRLLKIADSLKAEGWSLKAVDVRFFMGDRKIYEEVIESRNLQVFSFELNRTTLVGKLRLLHLKLKHLFIKIFNKSGFNLSYSLCRVALREYDELRKIALNIQAILYICNDPRLLPIASASANRHQGKVWYDSQEFFSGMGEADANISKQLESQLIDRTFIVTTSSKLIAARLQNTYKHPCVLPLRNAAKTQTLQYKSSSSLAGTTKPLEIIWHGFGVNLYGRGVNILLDALSFMRSSVSLTLQGSLSVNSEVQITGYMQYLELDRKHSILFQKPAHPEKIVSSLVKYDIGVAPEPGSDENQQLTSSNKIFEYLMAGLAVVASDCPGLIEVIEESQAGLIFPRGNAQALANCLDDLSENPSRLKQFQEAAKHSSSQYLNWESEISPVINLVNDSC